VDLTGIEPVTSSHAIRHNRQKRPTGRYLRAKCGQNYNQVANGLIVWNQPEFS